MNSQEGVVCKTHSVLNLPICSLHILLSESAISKLYNVKLIYIKLSYDDSLWYYLYGQIATIVIIVMKKMFIMLVGLISVLFDDLPI